MISFLYMFETRLEMAFLLFWREPKMLMLNTTRAISRKFSHLFLINELPELPALI